MKTFPIIISNSQRRNYNGLREVPWNFVETARTRIESNHSQTLEGLAQRGGLDWAELLYGLENKKLDFSIVKINVVECMEKVLVLLNEWSIKNKT